MINKKFFALAAFMLAFGVLFSITAFASTKVNIDSVRFNGKDIAEDKKNFVQDTSDIAIEVSLTGLKDLQGVYVQAILTDITTGRTVSDSTGKFDLSQGQSATSQLTMSLIDGLRKEKDYMLTIKVFENDGGVLEMNTYGIKFTGGTNGNGDNGAVDVSFDRVRVNGQIVAPSQTNFVDRSTNYFVIVEFTSREDLKGAHIEAILKDLTTGTVVADATPNFDLPADSSTSQSLFLTLLDGQKKSNSFELTVKIIDLDGNTLNQVYGLRTKSTAGSSGSGLDVSLNKVSVNNQVVASSQTNFIERSNEFDVVAEYTALENLDNAHVEAVLTDLNTGDSVADATSTFSIADGTSSSSSLKLTLLDKMKQSSSFQLTIKIIDQDGNTLQKVYGIVMKEKGTGSGGAGRSLDVSIDRVELDTKKILVENEDNIVVLDTIKKTLSLKVGITALESIKNAHADAILEFENGAVVSDSTRTFDLNRGQTSTKTFEIPVVENFQQNTFKLRVRIVDTDGNTEEKAYGLTISQQKFPFIISSIELNPENNIEAGKNLIVRVNFRNSGTLPLDGITSKVSIQDLGVSSVKYLGSIKNNDQTSQDFELKIPSNTATGTYNVRAEITSQFGGDSESKELPVSVLGGNDLPLQIVNDKVVIKVPITSQEVNDVTESLYAVTLTNQGASARSYTIILDGSNWADLRLGGSSTLIINPKESKTFDIYAISNGKAEGEQSFLVTIKSDEKVLSELQLKGDVTNTKSQYAGVFGIALKAFLVTLLVLFLLMVAVLLIRRRNDDSESSGHEIITIPEGESYY